MIMTVKDLIKKEIDNLPDNLLDEVLDFIQFLEKRREQLIYVRSAQELSSQSFQKIWDNEEDDIYDSI